MNKVTFTIGEQTIEFPVSSIKIDGNKFEVIVDTVKNPPTESKPINDKIWMITLITHLGISITRDIVGYYTSVEKAREALNDCSKRWIEKARVEWVGAYQINVHPDDPNDVLVYKIDYERVD